VGLGSGLAFAGDPQGGLEYLERGIEAFEREGYQPRRLQLGIDPRISCLTTSGFLLLLLGSPDRAVARADRAVALAEELEYPYSIGYALYHSGFLHHWRREPEIVRDRARRLLQLVEANDLPIWRALGTCLLGAATSALGDAQRGVRLIDEGLSWYQDLRTPPVFWPMIKFLQAGVYGQAGKAVEGMALIEEAIRLAGEEGILSPQIEITRGDLYLLLDASNVGAAVASYERAMDRAIGFKMRIPQLEALTRLVRLAPSTAEREARLASLRAIYGTFTEGFSTPDLLDAAQVLEGSRAAG
jgi:tetratricopeptide (TPR) repeat protein